MNTIVLAVDPGREKCGVAIVDEEHGILWKKVMATNSVPEKTAELAVKYSCAIALIGNGTSSKSMKQSLEDKLLAQGVAVESVDEYRTTDMARVRYWQENPPKGWRRLLPVSMQVPPEPVDDFVAVILAERYLKKNRKKN